MKWSPESPESMVSTTLRLLAEPVATVMVTGPVAPDHVRVKGTPWVMVKSELVKTGFARATEARAARAAATENSIFGGRWARKKTVEG